MDRITSHSRARQGERPTLLLSLCKIALVILTIAFMVSSIDPCEGHISTFLMSHCVLSFPRVPMHSRNYLLLMLSSLTNRARCKPRVNAGSFPSARLLLHFYGRKREQGFICCFDWRNGPSASLVMHNPRVAISCHDHCASCGAIRSASCHRC